jgi:PKD repeat protein
MSWLPAATTVILFKVLLIFALISQSSAGWSVYLGEKYDEQIASAITQPIGIASSYGVDDAKILENGNITEFDGSEIVNFTVSTSFIGGKSYISNRSLELIREEISIKINRGNDLVRDQGLDLIESRSGPRQIDQICAIYDCLVDEENWTYVDDWAGLENFQYSNYTLKKGQDLGGLGKGDCDDFAILLSALVESIGANPRIIFAHGPNGGHAYAEVYLGKDGGTGSDVDRIMLWLRCRYEVGGINVHRDLSNGDVWLNLDWWKEPGGANHPGGPFFVASNHVVVYHPEDSERKSPITHAKMFPIAKFQSKPENPTKDLNASFDASSSFDCDGNITSYLWDFGDGMQGEGMAVQHSYSQSGPMMVSLTVTDEDGLKSINSSIIQVNQPPAARFTFEPDQPMVNEQIRFDAGASIDVDGQIINYSWQFGNEGMHWGAGKDYALFAFTESGTFDVALTLVDDHGAKSTITIPINVSGARIANAKEGDSVSQFFDLMGEYTLYDPNKLIWVFVKQEGQDGKIFPQTLDSCNPHNASMKDGRWETRIVLGGSPPTDTGRSFDVLVTLADGKADQELRDLMYAWWCNGSRSEEAGFSSLPAGFHETDRISVKRSDDIWNCTQSIFDIHIPGEVNIMEIKETATPSYSNGSVEERIMIVGNRSADAFDDPIWVLEHAIDGRWYPISIDNEAEHVTSFIASSPSSPEWHIDATLSGRSGDPHELVAVLASSDADRELNEFQKSCAMAGKWPGLLTIELPAGLDEKNRTRLQRR